MATSLPAVPPATPVGLAVIGLGVIGRRMLEQAALVPGLRVRAAWDLDEQACQRAQADFPGTVIAPDAQSLVARADVDVVYVGTPPAFHRQYSLMAAAMGKRVFCEKPLTAHLDDAHRLVAELAEHGTPNAVNFVYASAPSADYLQRRLDAGDLGPVQSIEMRVFFARWPRDWQASAQWLRAREQGGFVREVLSHFVYLSIRLFGDCRLIGSQVAWPDDASLCERAASAVLNCAGIPVTLSASAGGTGPDEVIYTVRGSRGSLRLSNWYEMSESDGHSWRALEVPSAPYPDQRVAAYQMQLRNLERFGRGLPHPLPDAALALRVQSVIEGILSVR
ncbi:MAG: Gfo/Idh/MocA family oxidoreductase [Burkholderiaceae bacterium]|nr:Gfo/Idh/MocA family oxidoreductase [Burkholderiaceae bacterium]